MPKTWKDKTPEEKAKDMADHKRRKYLRESGRPSLVPSGPTILRLRQLRDEYSMSTIDIAKGAGLSQSTVSDLIRGYRSPAHGSVTIDRIPRRTHDKVAAYEPPDTFYNPLAPVPIIGPSRRLQALAFAGYSTLQMAQAMGLGDAFGQAWKVMRGRTRDGRGASWVAAATRDAVRDAYVKLVDTDPLDFGGTSLSVKRAKRAATQHGYAAAYCWDDDTIDDPDAHPEWTGACGTEEGYRIHIREGLQGNPMPLCDRCRDAVEVVAPTGPVRPILNRENLIAAIAASPMTVTAIAAEVVGGSAARDTFYRWRDGSRRPKSIAVIQKMATVLDVDVDYLIDAAAMQTEASVEPLKRGDFNPYVLRFALEHAGLSLHKASMLPGRNVSENTYSVWSRGVRKPAEPELLKPLADRLGVGVEFFYQ